MTILIMTRGMQITAENKVLTRIVRMLEGAPVRWYILSDNSMLVKGNKELLYELLGELTTRYLGKIEII